MTPQIHVVPVLPLVRLLLISGPNSPHGSDEEVEESGDGDPDEDVQGPLDHRAVHLQAAQRVSGTRTLRSGPAAVRRGGSGSRCGGFSHRPKGEQTEPNQNQNRRPRGTHPSAGAAEPGDRNS